MKYMLDTNILIYAIKNKPEVVLKRIQKVEPGDLCISTVTYAELMHGVEKSDYPDRNRFALALLLARIEVFDFDERAAECYGVVRADLERKGTLIGPLDMMIAGHALSLGCILVTNNIREFSRVKNLKTQNWAE